MYVRSSFVFTGDYVKLKIHTPMYTIAKALASPNSGLEVKDRVWLKITIPKSFIGKHLVNAIMMTWRKQYLAGFLCESLKSSFPFRISSLKTQS